MNIGYIVNWDDNCKDIADITVSNHMDYCKLHKYTLINDPQTNVGKRNSWIKFAAATSALMDKKYKNIDWFFWVDIDILIMDMSMKLETIVDVPDSSHIVAIRYYEPLRGHYIDISSDNPKWIRSGDPTWQNIHLGMFAFRNSQDSLDIFNSIINDKRYETRYIRDEDVFTILYMSNPDIRSKITFIPLHDIMHNNAQARINSIPHMNYIPYNTGEFIFHPAGASNKQKVDLLKKHKTKVKHENSNTSKI